MGKSNLSPDLSILKLATKLNVFGRKEKNRSLKYSRKIVNYSRCLKEHRKGSLTVKRLKKKTQVFSWKLKLEVTESLKRYRYSYKYPSTKIFVLLRRLIRSKISILDFQNFQNKQKKYPWWKKAKCYWDCRNKTQVLARTVGSDSS